MTRLLSFTEIETALTCFARWDFAYGGRLAGSTLKPLSTAPILSEGRAWGAAVAAWHAGQGTLLASYDAHTALADSVTSDADAAAKRGVPVPVDSQAEMIVRLGRMLDHYMATSIPLENLTKLEGEIIVPVPSRTGKRGSNAYGFQCLLDGWTVEKNGNPWIVEFKLRQGLQDPALMEKSMQYRLYTWAKIREGDGRAPVGILVDERLNEAPEPARIVQGAKRGTFRPSHDAKQMTTPELYVEACVQNDIDPMPDTVASLRGRVWQHRVPLMFRPSEIRETAQELVSAATLIGMLDRGEFQPIRNGARSRCRACKFSRICKSPNDGIFVESLYERTVPKRLRG